jgi:hypothetical protein
MDAKTEPVRCVFCTRRMNHIKPDGHSHAHKTCSRRNDVSICFICSKPVLCPTRHKPCVETYRRECLKTYKLPMYICNENVYEALKQRGSTADYITGQKWIMKLYGNTINSIIDLIDTEQDESQNN